jgi:hypothetical protein
MEATKDKDHIEEVEDDEEEDHMFNEKLQCRMYRKDFPEENDLVIVNQCLVFHPYYIDPNH